MWDGCRQVNIWALCLVSPPTEDTEQQQWNGYIFIGFFLRCNFHWLGFDWGWQCCLLLNVKCGCLVLSQFLCYFSGQCIPRKSWHKAQCTQGLNCVWCLNSFHGLYWWQILLWLISFYEGSYFRLNQWGRLSEWTVPRCTLLYNTVYQQLSDHTV